MAILGLEDRIIDRVVTTATNYNTYNSNYAPDPYSDRVTFGSTGTKTATTNPTTQTDNILADFENIARTYSPQPLYNVVTEHQVPDFSVSVNEDIVMIVPKECTYGTDYQILRRAEMVGQPLEVEEGFYYAHADELDGLEDALQSMQDIKTEMANYEANGNLDRLVEFARENGLNTTALRQPEYYGAVSGEVLAYTYYHEDYGGFFLLGTGKEFYNYHYQMASAFRINEGYEIEDTLTEELFHQSQPSWLMGLRDDSGGSYSELVEGHVRALKAKYFFERAEEATDQDEHDSYLLLSRWNYAGYRVLTQRFVELYGIDIEQETLEEMLDTKSPDEVAEILSEGVTRVPDRCVEGGYGYGKNKNNNNKRSNSNKRTNNNTASKFSNALMLVERLGDYFSGYAADDVEGNEKNDANKGEAENEGEGNGEQGSSDREGCGCSGDSE